MDADAAIRAIVARLPASDVAYLLEARGLPARGGDGGGGGGGGGGGASTSSSSSTLASALAAELVEWEWEAGEVGGPGAYHAPVIGAGGSLTVVANALWFFGGLNGDRVQDSGLWRWDLSPSGVAGFEAVHPSPASPPAPRLPAGHYAAPGPDGRLWVFPGPRNPEVGAAWAFHPGARVWEEVAVGGGVGPAADPSARRAVAAVPVEGGKALLALGGPSSAHTLHRFDFRARAWGPPLPLTGGPPEDGWVFGGAAVLQGGGGGGGGSGAGGGGGGRLVMWGASPPGGGETSTPPQEGEGGGGGRGGGGGGGAGQPSTTSSSPSSSSSDGPPVSLFALDWPSSRSWTRLPSTTPPPPLRTHAAGAIVGDRLILQGGRRPGPFNVTAAAWEFDFSAGAWRSLFASDAPAPSAASAAPGPTAREWHAAAGLSDCAVFVGGRVGLPPYEPVPVTPDTMSSAVDILWTRRGSGAGGGGGGGGGGAEAVAGSSAKPSPTPIGRAATLAALARHAPTAAPPFRDPTADVVLLAGEDPAVPLAAHRVVLAAHSTVFAAMWGSEMREGGAAAVVEVSLPDVSPSTATALLAYCYGSAATLPTAVSELRALYEVADKYDMRGLVAEVLASLRVRAGASEVPALLALSDSRNSEALRSVCADAAARSLPALLASPSFAALVTGAPALGLGLISEVVAKLGVGGGKGGDEAVPVPSSDDDDEEEEEEEEEEEDGVDGLLVPQLSPRGGEAEEEEGGEDGEEGDAPGAATPPASPRRGGDAAPAPPTPAQ